jgi:hypothetical protein
MLRRAQITSPAVSCGGPLPSAKCQHVLLVGDKIENGGRAILREHAHQRCIQSVARLPAGREQAIII